MLSAVGASAQTPRRPIGLEDFYRFETVSSPAIAPDGRRVAFVRTVVEEAENRRRSEIWLAPSDGAAPPIRLFGRGGSATEPVWSPDGQLLVFRRRQGGIQGEGIWALDLSRLGEPFQIDGLDNLPRFSPDGQWIGFIRAVRPNAAPEEPATEFERKLRERFTGRTHETVQYRYDGRGYLPDHTDEELFLIPRSGGTPRQLTRLGTSVEEAVWSSDSRRLALVANSHARDEYLYERADLWVTDLDGRLERLTDDGYHHDQVSWSPDGKSLVFRRQKGLSLTIAAKDSSGAPIDVYLMAASGGPTRNLTAKWDLIPEHPIFSPDGRQVFFSAEIAGSRHLFRVDLASGEVVQVTRGSRQLEGISFSSDFSRVAYVATDPTHPTEAFAATLQGDEVQLSHFNDSLVSAIDLVPAERLQYPSKDRTAIEGWLMLPRGHRTDGGGGGGPYPLVLSIHGGPHGAFGNEFSIPFQLLSAHGYAVLYTNPRGSTGYGERFLWATWGAWGRLDSEDVLAGVDHVASRYAIDPKRLGVSGYSYGGFLTNWVITHDHRFAAAISGAGISNWISDYGTADIPRTKESEFFGPPWEVDGAAHLLAQSPIMFAKGVTTPTLFIQGESDYRVPVEQGEQMYTALRKQRVTARMVRYPGMSHGGWTPWNTVHRYYEELDWWRRWLDRKPVP